MNPSDDKLPPRLFRDPFTKGPAKGILLKEADYKKSLMEYYSLRGWDNEGIPTMEKLKELGLEKYGKGII
jgi:aldehyde:ferredoxin oxidoreductase